MQFSTSITITIDSDEHGYHDLEVIYTIDPGSPGIRPWFNEPGEPPYPPSLDEVVSVRDCNSGEDVTDMWHDHILDEFEDDLLEDIGE